jgi:hypothetical protein
MNTRKHVTLVKKSFSQNMCVLEIFQALTMDPSLSLASIKLVIKIVETIGDSDGVWAQELFCTVQNFGIPSHDCGKVWWAGLQGMAGGATKLQL